MEVLETAEALRQARAELSGSLGLVLTLGALHAGHVSLIERASAENDHVAASIFVNPTQFNNPADLASYPRTLDADLDLMYEAGVDLVFVPGDGVMYPPNYQTYIEVETLAQGLEGEHRPGHFRGVATIVAKFFNLFQPTRSYFGQKDAQQVAVIKQMVRDLNFPLEIVTCPTLREADGLAMSSRNQRLTEFERQSAPVLYRALQSAEQAFLAGEREPEQLRAVVQETLDTEPFASVDYVSVADAESLEEWHTTITRPTLISLAVFMGDVRLIDNIVLDE